VRMCALRDVEGARTGRGRDPDRRGFGANGMFLQRCVVPAAP
jgi:hypothetical protein